MKKYFKIFFIFTFIILAYSIQTLYIPIKENFYFLLYIVSISFISLSILRISLKILKKSLFYKRSITFRELHKRQNKKLSLS